MNPLGALNRDRGVVAHPRCPRQYPATICTHASCPGLPRALIGSDGFRRIQRRCELDGCSRHAASFSRDSAPVTQGVWSSTSPRAPGTQTADFVEFQTAWLEKAIGLGGRGSRWGRSGLEIPTGRGPVPIDYPRFDFIGLRGKLTARLCTRRPARSSSQPPLPERYTERGTARLSFTKGLSSRDSSAQRGVAPEAPPTPYHRRACWHNEGTWRTPGTAGPLLQYLSYFLSAQDRAASANPRVLPSVQDRISGPMAAMRLPPNCRSNNFRDVLPFLEPSEYFDTPGRDSEAGGVEIDA